jgi:glutathione S-transferase
MKIKLYTFESNRAGGMIALLLHAKIPFKLKVINIEEWESKRHKFFGQTLPIIKIDGVQYSNELPTLLLIARKCNLLGSSIEDEYLITNLLYAINDLHLLILPTFLPESEEEYKQQNAKIDELINEKLPIYLKSFDKFLGNKKYFLGDKPCFIDIYMCYFINLLFKHPLRINLMDQVLCENAPNLNNFVISLAENELKEYYSKYYLINSPL